MMIQKFNEMSPGEYAVVQKQHAAAKLMQGLFVAAELMDVDGIESLFSSIVQLNPETSAHCHSFVARNLCEKGAYGLALPLYERAATLRPNSSEYKVSLDECRLKIVEGSVPSEPTL